MFQAFAGVIMIYMVTVLTLGGGCDSPWRRIVVTNITAESLRIEVDGQRATPLVLPGRDTMLDGRYRRSGAYGVVAYSAVSGKVVFRRDYIDEAARRMNESRDVHIVIAGGG